VLRLNGSREKIDEGVEAYKSRVAPAFRERDGYSGARLIVDRRTGAAMSITFWRDGDTSRASFEAMTSIRAETTSSFGAGTPEAKVYEAVVHGPTVTSSRTGSADGACAAARRTAEWLKSVPKVRYTSGRPSSAR
jgi:hypothetical protein